MDSNLSLLQRSVNSAEDLRNDFPSELEDMEGFIAKASFSTILG